MTEVLGSVFMHNGVSYPWVMPKKSGKSSLWADLRCSDSAIRERAKAALTEYQRKLDEREAR